MCVYVQVSHVLCGAEPDEFRRLFHGWVLANDEGSAGLLERRRDATRRRLGLAGRVLRNQAWPGSETPMPAASDGPLLSRVEYFASARPDVPLDRPKCAQCESCCGACSGDEDCCGFEVRDQKHSPPSSWGLPYTGDCDACWAFSSMDTLSARLYIQSRGAVRVLATVLPEEIAQEAGFAEGIPIWLGAGERGDVCHRVAQRRRARHEALAGRVARKEADPPGLHGLVEDDAHDGSEAVDVRSVII